MSQRSLQSPDTVILKNLSEIQGWTGLQAKEQALRPLSWLLDGGEEGPAPGPGYAVFVSSERTGCAAWACLSGKAWRREDPRPPGLASTDTYRN